MGVYVLSGEGWYRDEKRDLALSAGDFLHRIPGHAHQMAPYPGSDWYELFVQLPVPFMESLQAAHILDATFAELIWHPGSDEMLRLLGEEIFELLGSDALEDHQLAIIEMQRLVYRAALLHRRQQEMVQPAVERFVEMMRQEGFMCRPLPEIAELLRMPYETFRKSVRDALGMSPGHFRSKCRMEHAKSLLTDSDLTLEQIAVRVGYSDAFAFSKQFKHQTGISPSRWRG